MESLFEIKSTHWSKNNENFSFLTEVKDIKFQFRNVVHLGVTIFKIVVFTLEGEMRPFQWNVKRINISNSGTILNSSLDAKSKKTTRGVFRNMSNIYNGFFNKIVHFFRLFIIFVKSSTTDVCQGPKYVSDNQTLKIKK